MFNIQKICYLFVMKTWYIVLQVMLGSIGVSAIHWRWYWGDAQWIVANLYIESPKTCKTGGCL